MVGGGLTLLWKAVSLVLTTQVVFSMALVLAVLSSVIAERVGLLRGPVSSPLPLVVPAFREVTVLQPPTQRLRCAPLLGSFSQWQRAPRTHAVGSCRATAVAGIAERGVGSGFPHRRGRGSRTAEAVPKGPTALAARETAAPRELAAGGAACGAAGTQPPLWNVC
eukprot:TRINITY_DN5835_c0_g1_i1.p1 TRINITY_DN5835_c0_g1~~TRINITY_DN5835_c0_g1_i1.p1  ORF type:complete len:165 (-),score=23.33 TRINITY_DN5835_c0_g1_i1:574-1068(-)